METTRKIAIGVVMLIPSFVLSGLVYDLLHNAIGGVAWLAVLIIVVAAALTYTSIICDWPVELSKKFPTGQTSEAH